MAYVLHITRKGDWGEDEPKIMQTEWDALKTNGVLQSLFDIRYPDAIYAKWKDVYFSFRNGDITSVGPDEEGIKKMKEIATLLDAKVQGDDGELY